MKQEKKLYEAPELTVVTFKAERGYAGSDPSKALRTILFSSAVQSQDTRILDNRGSAESWGWQ